MLWITFTMGHILSCQCSYSDLHQLRIRTRMITKSGNSFRCIKSFKIRMSAWSTTELKNKVKTVEWSKSNCTEVNASSFTFISVQDLIFSYTKGGSEGISSVQRYGLKLRKEIKKIITARVRYCSLCSKNVIEN